MKSPVLHRKYGDFQHIIGVCNEKGAKESVISLEEKRIAAPFGFEFFVNVNYSK